MSKLLPNWFSAFYKIKYTLGSFPVQHKYSRLLSVKITQLPFMVMIQVITVLKLNELILIR